MNCDENGEVDCLECFARFGCHSHARARGFHDHVRGDDHNLNYNLLLKMKMEMEKIVLQNLGDFHSHLIFEEVHKEDHDDDDRRACIYEHFLQR